MARTHQVIHLFEKEWIVGKINDHEKGKHVVIRDPERKEYHLWNEEIVKILGDWRKDTPDPALVKRYILTEILDNRDNWCYDLHCKPLPGFLVTVLYDNGTLKKIQFVKEFEPVELEMKQGYKGRTRTIHPVAWKIR